MYQQVVSFRHREKRTSHVTCLGKAGNSGLYKRDHVMSTSAYHALKVSHHTISSILEIERLLFPGSFWNAPVDFLLQC